MSRIRILADDLTGALDSAAAFTGDVPVYLDAAPADEDPGGAPVAVVATATRDVTLDALPDLLAPSIRWLAEATVAFKKVDSLLRGNSCAESAYVARAGGFDTLVFAPAFPAQRRLTLDGRHWVVPAGKALAQREPIGTGRIADAFAVLGLPVAGSDDVTGRPRVAIPDVGSDDDLARIAVGSVGPSPTKTLWCGSAGLAHAIAAAHGLAAPPDRVEPTAAGRGPVLVISASHHPVVRKQWGVLKGAERGALMASHGQPAALRAAFRAMGQPFDFALFDLSPTRTLPPADAAALLARQLGAIVAEAPRPGTLVVVGGDTLRALCRAAAASALVACPALRPGWGCARLVGGTWDGVRCHTRSGAFGDPDDLRTMLRLVAGRTEPLKETPP